MKRFLLFVLFVGLGFTSATAQWQQLSEPKGGQILDMALHNDAIYISVANIIYKSTDNGQTWVNSRGDLPSFSDINSIGGTSSALYAGVNDGGMGDKLFVSYDGGATWASTGGKGATNLGVDWENIGDTVFVTTNFGSVYRSVDNGATFEDMAPAGIGRTLDVWGDDLFYLGQGIVRISTDRGDSVSAAIGTSSDITFRFGTMRTALRVDTTLIVGAQGVFKLDADSVWQRASNGMPLSLGSPRPVITKLAQLGDWIWAFSDVGIYVSADTANTWTLLENSPETGFIQRVKIDGNTIHLATQKGYYISNGATDASVTFEKRIEGLNHVTVNHIESIDGELFLLGASTGILKSGDDGDSFTQAVDTLVDATFTSLTRSDSLYFAASGSTMLSSVDGSSWDIVEEGVTSGTIAAKDSLVLSSFGSQVYRSPDNGKNWEAVTQQLQLGAIAPSSYAFHDSVIFGGFSNVNVFGSIARSLDNGETWEITDGAGTMRVSRRVIFIEDTAYASVATTFTGGGVARTTDFGDTWEVLENSLNDEIGGSFDLAISGTDLYTVSFGGIWKSSDGARSWEKIDISGLPFATFFAGSPLVVNGNFLYYAPGNSGVFKTAIDGMSTSVMEENEEAYIFELSQNYPNPFNPNTVISFQLAENSLVSLKVYNLLGQVVAELVNQRMGSGTHSIIFDGSGLSSGVYIYRLVSGNQVQTKKMMLIK